MGCLGFVIAIAGHSRAASMGYVQTDLVTDIPALATQTGAHLDPNLLNPWGLAFFPGASPFWINENNAGFSALYFADGVPLAALPDVIIPAPAAPTGGTPTGIIANIFVGTGAFPIVPVAAPSKNFGPSLFIFDTEDGTVEAWNQTILPNISSAVIVVDNSAGGGPTGAVYKGLALGSNPANGALLYAANFRTGQVDVFDKNFKSQTPPPT